MGCKILITELITKLEQTFNGLTGAVLADAVPWSVITADQTAVINKGYFTNKSTLLTLTKTQRTFSKQSKNIEFGFQLLQI